MGLAFGGVAGVFIAAYIVKSLPLFALRWLVIVVIAYAAFAMLRSSATARKSRSVVGSSAFDICVAAGVVKLKLYRAHVNSGIAALIAHGALFRSDRVIVRHCVL